MAKSCSYNGSTYSDGSVICMNGNEYRCDDGSWVSLGTSCNEEIINTFKDGDLTIEYENDLKELNCLKFYSTGEIGKIGIRNNCSDCQNAVVNWIGVGIKKYKVPGYDNIVINVESNNGKLLGEEPC